MSENFFLHKSVILAELRRRRLDARADWVDRTLPDAVDTVQNAALLKMLKLEVDELAAAGR